MVQIRHCHTCNEPMPNATKNGTYCSEKCRDAATSQAHGIRYCLHCDGPLPPLAQAQQKYCDEACRRDAARGAFDPDAVEAEWCRRLAGRTFNMARLYG